jgi:hypothetical protein
LTLFDSEWVGGEATGLCGACGYDLAGLPEGSCCPECGSVMLGFTKARRVVRLKRERLPAWLLGVGVIFGAACLGVRLPEEILVHVYRAEGFSEETARHAIPIRELRQGPWPLLGPLWTACGFVPLLSSISRRVWSCAAAVLLLGVALVVSLACFAGEW